MMKEIKFTNSAGASIEISGCAPYVLSNISGTEPPGATILNSESYQQHGTKYIGTLLTARKIKMDIEVIGDTRAELETLTRTLMSLFNPVLGEGKLIYTNNSGSWRIYGAVYDGPRPYRKDKNPFHQYVQVSILCADPDWLSLTDKQIRMVDFIGGLTFPITFPISFAERGEGGKVQYTGDNPAPVILDFRVAEGGTSVSDPRIENEKGEFIQIHKTILEGERLIINTNPKKLSVTLIKTDGTETDAWDCLYGTANTYIHLHQGENIFKFSAASGDPELYLKYAERYVGVV